MNKTKIEYCDSTWNPVTGCRHGCGYCYARGIAKRFEGAWDGCGNQKLGYPYSAYEPPMEVTGNEHGGLGLKYCVGSEKNGDRKLINAPYPYGFHPTLHRHRLESGTKRWKKPRTVFVGSMCDLFGEWVPDEWIKAVFDACVAAPQHRYLFLTKNPARYDRIDMMLHRPCPPYLRMKNLWFGATITNQKDSNRYIAFPAMPDCNRFLSIEPILSAIKKPFSSGTAQWSIGKNVSWVIIGAMTGPGANEHRPRREWIDDICTEADHWNIPVFMKDSLAGIVGEGNMRRELPWEEGSA
jgi:protein gp37